MTEFGPMRHEKRFPGGFSSFQKQPLFFSLDMATCYKPRKKATTEASKAKSISGKWGKSSWIKPALKPALSLDFQSHSSINVFLL